MRQHVDLVQRSESPETVDLSRRERLALVGPASKRYQDFHSVPLAFLTWSAVKSISASIEHNEDYEVTLAVEGGKSWVGQNEACLTAGSADRSQIRSRFSILLADLMIKARSSNQCTPPSSSSENELHHAAR
jgi:hypothetical protein